MEKRLKEAGISTEQLGQHELVKEIHRIQVWIHSLNGGWSSNTPPDVAESDSYPGKSLYGATGAVRKGTGRNSESPIHSDSIQSCSIESDPISSNPIQFNWIHFSPMGINSSPIQWTPIHSDPIQWTPIKLDQFQ